MKNKLLQLIAPSWSTMNRMILRNLTGGDLQRIIVEHTEVSREHLTPEIALRLITPNCPLWHQTDEQNIFNDPFWAFYWPGGQALTRFILDRPDIVRGKSVLDVGSGCGASAVAAVKSGASQVTANDVDPVAITAIHLNCKLNSVSIQTCSDDLIGQKRDEWKVVLLGDMFYDEEFTGRVFSWIRSLSGCSVFIGDPGRVFLEHHPLKKNLRLVYQVELPSLSKQENYGFTDGYVWQLLPHKSCDER